METTVASPNISMKEARSRLNQKFCLNCGKPQTNKELNSCNDKKCVKILRPLYRWAHNLVYGLDPKTYVGGNR